MFAEAVPHADPPGRGRALHATLRAPVELTRLAPGSLPVAEHKTRTVFRTAAEVPEVVRAMIRP